MYSLSRVLFFSGCFALLFCSGTVLAQEQDKELAKTYMEQAELILAETKAEVDYRLKSFEGIRGGEILEINQGLVPGWAVNPCREGQRQRLGVEIPYVCGGEVSLRAS